MASSHADKQRCWIKKCRINEGRLYELSCLKGKFAQNTNWDILLYAMSWFKWHRSSLSTTFCSWDTASESFESWIQCCTWVHTIGFNDVPEMMWWMMSSELSHTVSKEWTAVDWQDFCRLNWLVAYNNIPQFMFERTANVFVLTSLEGKLCSGYSEVHFGSCSTTMPCGYLWGYGCDIVS